MRRILYIGDAASPHLTRWVLAAHRRQYAVGVFSLRKPANEIAHLSGVEFSVYEVNSGKFSAPIVGKFGYLKAIPQLKKFVADFKPDVIHAHYASSYGLLASRLKFHPLILSAWGSDVYAFGDGFVGRSVLQHNFSKADLVLSTSEVMKARVEKFTSKEVLVTPFGVDTSKFFPGKESCPFFPPDALIIGMVKTMERIYGIEYVLGAFKKLRTDFPQKNLRLLLVGGGSQRAEYEGMCADLGLSAYTHFTGRVAFEDVPKYHRMIDIFVNPSLQESFGVSVLEAMSCGKPVVVSDVGGLAEIVQDQATGLYCKPSDNNSLVEAITKFITNDSLKRELAEAGRAHVVQHYNQEKVEASMFRDAYDPLFSQLNIKS